MVSRLSNYLSGTVMVNMEDVLSINIESYVFRESFVLARGCAGLNVARLSAEGELVKVLGLV